MTFVPPVTAVFIDLRPAPRNYLHFVDNLRWNCPNVEMQQNVCKDIIFDMLLLGKKIPLTL